MEPVYDTLKRRDLFIGWDEGDCNYGPFRREFPAEIHLPAHRVEDWSRLMSRCGFFYLVPGSRLTIKGMKESFHNYMPQLGFRLEGKVYRRDRPVVVI